MGQTIGWRKYDSQTGKSEWAKVPDWFEGKWTGRWDWFQSLYASGETLQMGNDDEYLRPVDFNAVRQHLANISDESVVAQHWPDLDMVNVRNSWKQCTDWLEANPDVFVDYG